MTDRRTVERWLAGYLRAWASNRPADIEALFTPNAIYRPTPVGRCREYVEWWIERATPDPGEPASG